jgi:hypothetical protein
MSETSLTPMNVKATTKRAQTEADAYTIQPTSRALLVREHPPDQTCCVGTECFQTIHPKLARFSLAACHGRREQLAVVSGAVPEV